VRRIPNLLSWLAIGWTALAIIGITVAYNNFVQKPMQGGWNSYRLHEFAPQITPYALLFLSLVITRFAVHPRWLYFFGMTVLLLASGFITLGLVVFSVEMKHGGSLIPATVFFILISGHLFFLSRPRPQPSLA
jgi:hypothetical protein